MTQAEGPHHQNNSSSIAPASDTASIAAMDFLPISTTQPADDTNPKRKNATAPAPADESHLVDLASDGHEPLAKKPKTSKLTLKSGLALEINRLNSRMSKALYSRSKVLKEDLKEDLKALTDTMQDTLEKKQEKDVKDGGKKHKEELQILRQQYIKLRGINKMNLHEEIVALKNEVESLKNENAALELETHTMAQKSVSDQVQHLQRELHSVKAAKADMESMHAAERAAGILDAHAAEDHAEKQAVKREDEVEENSHKLVDIHVAKRTKELKAENQNLMLRIVDLKDARDEAEKEQKLLADERVAKCKMEHQAEVEALKAQLAL